MVRRAADGSVAVRSGRMTDWGKVLRGQEVALAAFTLSNLFTLCGQAHRAACQAVLELDPEPDGALLWGEIARESLLQVKLRWPVTADEAQMPALPLMALARPSLAGGKGLASAISDYLARHVLGMSHLEFRRFSGWPQFEHWLASCPSTAAASLRLVQERGLQGLGRHEGPLRPEFELHAVARAMSAPGFCAQPEWGAEHPELGPLARQARHPVVAESCRRFGNGLFSRLVARLFDVAMVPILLEDGLVPLEFAPGMARVETARGPLFHTATVRSGKVQDYAILAPTEWNFHPRGPAVRAMESAPPDTETLALQWLVNSLDPCVDVKLELA
ncbi:MAG: nickel-dependent hydrogenase large subunit [Planctomycetota bacterium]